MLRTLLLTVAASVCACRASAQDAEFTKFITEFNKAFEFKDEKLIDKALRTAPDKAVRHFQDLRVELWSGKKEVQPKTDALKASWARVFEKSPTLEKVERWIESQDQRSYDSFVKIRGNVSRAWDSFLEASKDTTRRPYEAARDVLMTVARQMESTGHRVDMAEAWNLVAICLTKMPDKTLQDRKDAVFALEQYISMRQAWDFTGDMYYARNAQFLKTEKSGIEAAEKVGEKRKAEGYSETAKGIDALVVAGAAEELHDLQFELLPAWDTELDYSQKGGPVPACWWIAPFAKDVMDSKLTWFRRTELHLMRLSASKFGVSTSPGDPKRTQEVDAGGKAKPSQFFLDADKKVPYGMFFWIGTDKERIGEVEVNLAPADINTSVFYRSAASWKTTIGGEAVIVYDDNSNGSPMDGDPMADKFPMHTLGTPGAIAPLLDSMRVGKGPRVPFSEFVQVGGAWRWLHKVADGKLGTKPLNPEYCKLGKVKLQWNGPKPTAPSQLVIQGRGDFKTACFDVASGKDVEVPAAEYNVIWGRIVQGKGARLLMGTIYGGDSKPFQVEAGKTFELKMGAPFDIQFERGGADPEVKIDATRVALRESSGCVVAELQGMVLVPEVLAAKADDGKGAKTVAKFLKLTDPEFLFKAADKLKDIGIMAGCFPMPEGVKDGSMELKFKLPGPGMKVALSIKKHALFGKIDSPWK